MATLIPRSGKVYSIQEVAKHNTEDDIWIIIDGRVYDMTDYVDGHPGGKRILMSVAGKDATQQFANFHNILSVMARFGNKLYIGELDNAHKEPPKPKTELFGDLVPYGDPTWYQGWKSPYYNDSHRRLREYMRNIIETELKPFSDEWSEAGQVPKSVYKSWGERGLLTCFTGMRPWPMAYVKAPPPCGIKPEEWDTFHWLVVQDELARATSPASSNLTLGPSIALPAIINFGNQHQKDKILPEVMAGDKVVCLAISEPFAGSDVANITTTAVKTPDGKHYIVNGEKKWITCGTYADYFVTAVRTGNKGATGMSVLIIERQPGLKTRILPTQAGTSSGQAYVTFENVKVPVENLLGVENQGFKVLMFNFNKERLSICMGVPRSARVCFEEAMKYANKRKTFGQYLIEHGVIRNKFGHMARMIEATQAWLELTCYQWDKMSKKEADEKLGSSIALLKAQCTQTFELCAREASQIMGGIAYTRGGQGGVVERLYRNVRGAAIPGGSEEIMLDFGIRQGLKIARAQGAKI
ncbi:hypothetical protein SmJEL517_g04008 [Synchytrium microbalum]|uniref:Cytochrome b5 heme-binding domain-containing protein n=1 Tax=Synchytrium microbalum TaxID=1806994 RepID=A0A507C010_9FUNG|nr:uncharacterized protein SmJEL517_g04008 [Synchytrium microbalum]TPX33022.1 hypothetical protein SmJEL517_g04008 [Synchytrium microbalum]